MCARILALDADPVTVESLADQGNVVVSGEIGFRTGRPDLSVAPHEFDLIVCDLTRPATFSMEDWGPFRGNDNRKFTPAQPSGPLQYYMDTMGRTLPVFRIITETQLAARGRGTFGPNDVFNAIERAGTPAIMMLNPEWVQHAPFDSPNIFGVTWRFKPTRAELVRTEDTLTLALPRVGDDLQFRTPLKFCIEGGANRLNPSMRQQSIASLDLVTNAVGDVFGQFVPIGKGAIWALPPFRSNRLFLGFAAQRIDELRRALNRSGGVTTHPAPDPPPRVEAASPDLFVCHASEDKDQYVRPLVEKLTAEDATVWYDEYELLIGDRLRQKIDEGLRNSRHGLVMLSHKFFTKKWPQDELDALAELSGPGKKILPVWIDVAHEDIKEYSPLLAGVLAAQWSDGIERVVRDILRSIRD